MTISLKSHIMTALLQAETRTVPKLAKEVNAYYEYVQVALHELDDEGYV